MLLVDPETAGTLSCYLKPTVLNIRPPHSDDKNYCVEDKDCHLTHLAYAGKRNHYDYYYRGLMIHVHDVQLPTVAKHVNVMYKMCVTFCVV